MINISKWLSRVVGMVGSHKYAKSKMVSKMAATFFYHNFASKQVRNTRMKYLNIYFKVQGIWSWQNLQVC